MADGKVYQFQFPYSSPPKPVPVNGVADGKVYQFQFPYSSPPVPGNGNVTTTLEGVATKVTSLQKNMTAKMGWLRHVLTVLSVVIFVSKYKFYF